MNAPTPGYAELSAEQRAFFEDNGYLVIKGALPPEVVGEIDAAVDEVHARVRAAGRLPDDGKFQLRNCIATAAPPTPRCRSRTRAFCSRSHTPSAISPTPPAAPP